MASSDKIMTKTNIENCNKLLNYAWANFEKEPMDRDILGTAYLEHYGMLFSDDEKGKAVGIYPRPYLLCMDFFNIENDILPSD